MKLARFPFTLKPPVAVWHWLVVVCVMEVMAGVGFTVISWYTVSEWHPFEVQITQKVADDGGETGMEVRLLPLLQSGIPVHPFTVSVSGTPLQRVVSFAVMAGVAGLGLTVTLTRFEAREGQLPTLQVAV